MEDHFLDALYAKAGAEILKPWGKRFYFEMIYPPGKVAATSPGNYLEVDWEAPNLKLTWTSRHGVRVVETYTRSRPPTWKIVGQHIQRSYDAQGK